MFWKALTKRVQLSGRLPISNCYYLIVGASQYQQQEVFSPLPGALRDARWFEEYLHEISISENNLKSITGKAARKEKILRSICSFGKVAKSDATLVIFYSGHGSCLKISEEFSLPVLHCFDTSVLNRRKSSISISEIFGAVREAKKFAKLHLFLDACFMDVKSISTQLPELIGGLNEIETVTCLLANNLGPSIEGVKSPQGEFSNLLLSTIRILQKQDDPTISELHAKITKLTKDFGPERSYSIALGDVSVWPFKFQRETESTTAEHFTEIFRRQTVEDAHDFVRCSQKNISFLTGPSGIGKSTILSQLHKSLSNSPFFSFKVGDVLLSEASLAQKFSEELLRHSGIANVRKYSSLAVQKLSDMKLFEDEFNIVFVDGGEHLSPDQWSLIENWGAQGHFHVVSTARTEFGVQVKASYFNIPPLNDREATLIASKIGRFSQTVIARSLTLSSGNPLKFVKELTLGSPDAQLPEHLWEFCQCIFDSDGFENSNLFCAVFNQNIDQFIELQKIGLLQNKDGLFDLHDDAKRLFQKQAGNELRVLQYWTHELDKNHSIIAANYIVSALLSGSYKNSSKIEVIGRALELTEGSLTSEQIRNASISATGLTDASSFPVSIEILSKRGDRASLKQVIDAWAANGVASYERNLIEIDLALARASWWYGDFELCIQLAKSVIESGVERYRESAELELGIAYFFLGNWTKVTALLEPICYSTSADLREVAWAKLILGTTLGITGADLKKGKKLLAQAIEAMIVVNDSAGLAIANGNLGEILWKTGEFPASKTYLVEGREIANSTGMKINEIEAMRNLLQLYLRSKGPFSSEVNVLVQELSKFEESEIGAMKMMQLANTIATAELYRQNLSIASKWIEIAATLTAQNREYEIYTLGNKAIYSILEGAKEEADQNLDKMVALAGSGGNWIALSQISGDIKECAGRSNKKWVATSVSKIEDEIGKINARTF